MNPEEDFSIAYLRGGSLGFTPGRSAAVMEPPEGYKVVASAKMQSDEICVERRVFDPSSATLVVGLHEIESDLVRTVVHLTASLREPGDWWLTSRVCPAGLAGWVQACADGVFDQTAYERARRRNLRVEGGEPLLQWARMHRALAGQVGLLESLGVQPADGPLGPVVRVGLDQVSGEERGQWLSAARSALALSRHTFATGAERQQRRSCNWTPSELLSLYLV